MRGKYYVLCSENVEAELRRADKVSCSREARRPGVVVKRRAVSRQSDDAGFGWASTSKVGAGCAGSTSSSAEAWNKKIGPWTHPIASLDPLQWDHDSGFPEPPATLVDWAPPSQPQHPGSLAGTGSPGQSTVEPGDELLVLATAVGLGLHSTDTVTVRCTSNNTDIEGQRGMRFIDSHEHSSRRVTQQEYSE